MPLKYMDRPTMDELSATACWCRPSRTSTVLMMGRALRGIFVRGTMAIKAHMRNVRTRGYPAVLRMFEVTASITSSPNMRMPATAVVASSRYCTRQRQRQEICARGGAETAIQ
jgi:hypothetical protein